MLPPFRRVRLRSCFKTLVNHLENLDKMGKNPGFETAS
jgi:hypothetical protein